MGSPVRYPVYAPAASSTELHTKATEGRLDWRGAEANRPHHRFAVHFKGNNNRGNAKWVDQVNLVVHDERGFASFPDDPELANFDTADRKFVAVSGAHPDKPSIAPATDSKWLGWAPALQ